MDAREGLFAFLICAVMFGSIVKIVKYAIDAKTAHRAQLLNQTGGLKKQEEFDARLDRLEKRMANLETIILDREKHENFERELG